MRLDEGARTRDAVAHASGEVMAEVEIFTPTGVLAGTTARVPLTNDGPDLSAPLAVGDARWYPMDGSKPSHRGETRVTPDDILLIATPPPELTVHMTLFAVTLDVGPYRVTGCIATHPGFDPERALARPSGGFVALRDTTIELPGSADAGKAARPHLHVNRYAVDRVDSTLMLGFFFPGAQLVTHDAAPRTGTEGSTDPEPAPVA